MCCAQNDSIRAAALRSDITRSPSRERRRPPSPSRREAYLENGTWERTRHAAYPTNAGASPSPDDTAAREWSPEQPNSFRPPDGWRVDESLRKTALSVQTQEREAREAGPPPHPAMAGRPHVAPRTLQLQELRGRELPKLVAWTVEEWRGVAEPPTPEECLYEVTQAHGRVWKRDINELGRMRAPPPSVMLVLEAVVILLGYKPRTGVPPTQWEAPAGWTRSRGRGRRRDSSWVPLPGEEGAKKVDFSDAIQALLRDPLRLWTEVENATPPKVTAAKLRSLKLFLQRTEFGSLRLEQLPSQNACLSLYYWAVACINFVIADAARRTRTSVAERRAERPDGDGEASVAGDAAPEAAS